MNLLCADNFRDRDNVWRREKQRRAPSERVNEFGTVASPATHSRRTSLVSREPSAVTGYAFSATRSRRRLQRSVVRRSEVTDDGFRARAVVSASRAIAQQWKDGERIRSGATLQPHRRHVDPEERTVDGELMPSEPEARAQEKRRKARVSMIVGKLMPGNRQLLRLLPQRDDLQFAVNHAQLCRGSTNECPTEDLFGKWGFDTARHGAFHRTRAEGDVVAAVVQEPIDGWPVELQLDAPIGEGLRRALE